MRTWTLDNLPTEVRIVRMIQDWWEKPFYNVPELVTAEDILYLCDKCFDKIGSENSLVNVGFPCRIYGELNSHPLQVCFHKYSICTCQLSSFTVFSSVIYYWCSNLYVSLSFRWHPRTDARFTTVLQAVCLAWHTWRWYFINELRVPRWFCWSWSLQYWCRMIVVFVENIVPR